MENPVKRFLETVLLFDRFFSQPQDFHFWGKTSLLSEFKSIKSIKIADKSIMCRIVPPHKNEKLLWSCFEIRIHKINDSGDISYVIGPPSSACEYQSHPVRWARRFFEIRNKMAGMNSRFADQLMQCLVTTIAFLWLYLFDRQRMHRLFSLIVLALKLFLRL